MVFTRHRPPSLARPGSSPHELSRSFRVRSCLSPAQHSLLSASLEVLSPNRDTSVRSPLIVGVPTPNYVSPSAFHTLTATSSSTRLAGLFHPTATSGIHTSGAFPATKPAHLIGESYPHVVGRILLPASCLTDAGSTYLTSRALIRVAVRCSQRAV
jgi:hypothetical protein